MPNPILSEQAMESLPLGTNLGASTSLLIPNSRSADGLDHFSTEVFDLSAESNLARLVKVFLGDAGMGQINRRLLLARLQQSIHGSRFYDLDRFYGALFGMQRRLSETLTLDPYSGVGTSDEWLDQLSRDASYRSRIEQFSRAISYGATTVGMELMAEAILSVDCEVYEAWTTMDLRFRTHGQIETDFATHGAMEALTHGQLAHPSAVASGVTYGTNRREFVVRPKRPITPEEEYDLRRVLAVLKPVDALLTVDPDGALGHYPVAFRGLAASSENWEVIQQVLPGAQAVRYPTQSAVPVEQPGPLFASYQGEAWSFISEVFGISAYAENVLRDVIATEVFSRVVFADGSYANYSADLAAKRIRDLMSGRGVSDGVLVSAPYSAPRQAISRNIQLQSDDSNRVINTVIAPLYSDRLPAQQMADGQNQVGHQDVSQPDGFWAGPEREVTDNTREIVEFRLTAPKTVNYVSCRVAHFPQVATVEVYRESSGDWKEVARLVVRDSNPKYVPSGVMGNDDEHPQHPETAEHWVKLSTRFSPVDTIRVRIVMVRDDTGQYPRWPPPTIEGKKQPPVITGDAMPYSLAVRDFEIGYRVTSKDDLVGVVLGQTKDILGSLTVFSHRRETARGILDGNPWRCEPQPIKDAVVNFYADVRDANGNGQVIDRFFLDPLYPGPWMNLYYSDEIPTGDWEASDDVPQLDVVGVITPTADDLVFPVGAAATITIPNYGIQFDASKSWWLGVELIPGFTQTEDHQVLDFGGNVLSFVSSVPGVSATSSSGVTVNVPTQFIAGQVVRILLAYNPETTVDFAKGLTLIVRSQGPESSSVADGTAITDWPESLIVGSGTNGSAVRLRSLMLKQRALTAAEKASWFTDPQTFTRKTRYRPDDDGSSNNALLRFDPGHFALSPTGFLGGPGDIFGLVSWTVIARDYMLQRGYVDVPKRLAKFWKFEFTNLVPEPYGAMLPIDQKIDLFSGNVSNNKAIQKPSPSARVGNVVDGPSGSNINSAVLPQLRFSDALAKLRATESGDSQKASPTESLFARNLADAERLRKASWAYSLIPWHVENNGPQWERNGTHVYETATIKRKDRIAFFVGLKSITGYRVSYQADDDTPVYREHFIDADQVEAGYTWTFDPNRISTEATYSASMTSKVYASRHNVRSIQFATQQSPAVQVIDDDDYRDPILIGYDWSGTITIYDSSGVPSTKPYWKRVGDAKLSYDSSTHSVRIDREAIYRARFVGRDHGFAQPMVQPVFAWRTITVEDTTAAAATEGGIESPSMPVSVEGQVHAAVRITAIDDLESPVYLQIVNGNDDSLIMEKALALTAGQLTEDYLSYRIGSIVASGTPVKARVVQRGKAANSWIVDTLSLFDDGIVWEFSVDGGTTFFPAMGVRNNKDGVLTFPEPGNQLVWRVKGTLPYMYVSSLQIRPWYEYQLAAKMSNGNRGPNLSVFDHDPPVDDDPEFNEWSKPVPYSWFLASQRFPTLSLTDVVVSRFRRYYGRPFTETTVTSDTWGRVSTLRRGFSESVPTATDVSTRSAGSWPRSLTETATPTDMVVTWVRVHSAFVHPVVEPI